MGIISKQLLNKETIKFRANLEKERLFGQYPVSLLALKSAALSSLEDISNSLASKIGGLVDFDINDIRALKSYIKNDQRLNTLMKYANDNVNEEIVSNVIKKCANIDSETAKEFDVYQMYSETTNKIIQETNDILSKIDAFTNKVGNLLNESIRYVEAGIMAYYIIKLVIKLFRDTDFPSLFRLKYIQKLIRYTLASIVDYIGDQFNSIKNWLKTIDGLMIGFAIAGSLYLLNRRLSQDEAKKIMLQTACDKTKQEYEEAERLSILEAQTEPSVGKFQISLSCPIHDTNFVPKEPYENKLSTFSCPIGEPQEVPTPELESGLILETALKAKIENNREGKLSINVKKEQFVDNQTILATLQGTPVYSPVEGYIESYNDKEIILNDIEDPSEDPLITEANKLNSKYQELYEIKSILREYEIICIYPIMLKESPVTDGSIGASERKGVLYENMESRYEPIRDKWYGTKVSRGLIEDYEKRVEKITSKDNVEEKAKNDETFKIKEELDKEDKKLFNFLLQIDDDARNIARQTEAKKGEYELLEYYVNNLALKLNENSLSDAEEEKQKYLPGFRNEINKFVRQRYVIEGWKPEKISDKAIELLKDLEKGATNGKKLWDEGLEKYNERKKLSDVKKWLENIDPRKKLETNEVEKLINRIYFLYDFYLNIKAYTEDYKNLKESNEREQTSREGNYLIDFFDNLQIRYSKLPKEILEIEKKLEDLSLISNYYNQTIEGTEYRIYSINPLDDDCNSSYKSEVKSKYGFGDIQYWLRWCGFATLTGLVPIYWSTGLFLPGPILLPVIYIPIKPIETKWGFILIGLTITGIYPFPLLLFGNLTSNYTSIIPIPGIDLIKNTIKDIKEKISEQLSDFKKNILKNKLDEYTEKIQDLNEQISEVEKRLVQHKINRPPKTINDITAYSEWESVKLQIKNNKTELELQKWKLEQKHQIINSAYSSGSQIGNTGESDLKKLEDAEKSINDKLDMLVEKVDSVETILAPLPTTLQPNTADFGLTLKNPKPVIEIQDKLNDNINDRVLDKIQNSFKLNNEGFMAGAVKFNKSEYDLTLQSVRFLPTGSTVSKDPFPKYENISPVNVQYLKFLTTEYLPKGAQTYGIPGQLPAPVG